MRSHDIAEGKVFGRLTVVGPRVIEFRSGRNRGTYPCVCACGKARAVAPHSLISGRTVSCGCHKDELTSARNTTHGMRHTRLYTIWFAMRDRCSNPNHTSYHRYGGRGITVSPEWDGSFVAFHGWASRSGYRDDLTIERIDNDRDYEPGNCTWITLRDQCRNKSTSVFLEAFGERKLISEWMQDPRCAVRARATIYRRLEAGWTTEQAIGIRSSTNPGGKPGTR